MHTNAMSPERYLPETMGPGVAFLDYDNDGYPDMLVTSYGRCILRELRSSPNHVHAMLQIAYELMKQGKYAEAPR